MKTAQHICACILLLAASVAMLAIASAAWSVHQTARELPPLLERQLDGVRDAALSIPDRVLPPVLITLDAEAERAQQEIRHAVNTTAVVVNDAVNRADSQLDTTQQIAAAALGEIHQIRGDFRPVLENAALLEANYAALPDRLATEMQPAWLSIQPEITCRTLDGDGYGGCMRGRINGLLGEAVRAGGVFDQQFPALAKSITGIAVDAHGWTAKYVQPHPMHTGDYFKAAGKITVGIGTAALRGGLF